MNTTSTTSSRAAASDLAERLLQGWGSRRDDPVGAPQSRDKQAQRLGQFCSQAAWGPASELIARGALADASRSRASSDILGVHKPVLALQLIAKGQAPDLLRQALKGGAKARACAQSLPCPPLFLALSNLDEPSVRALLEAGADPDALALDWEEFSSRQRRALKRSPLTAVCALAARKLSYGPARPGHQSPWEPLPGMSIPEALSKALACCQTLIEFGANLDAADEAKETPLCLAAAADLTELVRALVKAGARIDALGFSSRGWVGALEWRSQLSANEPPQWGERESGGFPPQWGSVGPVEAALIHQAGAGLGALIDAGADLNSAQIARTHELSRQRREFFDFDTPDPTGPCPWMGALARLEGRQLRAAVALPAGSSPAPAPSLRL